MIQVLLNFHYSVVGRIIYPQKTRFWSFHPGRLSSMNPTSHLFWLEAQAGQPLPEEPGLELSPREAEAQFSGQAQPPQEGEL